MANKEIDTAPFSAGKHCQLFLELRLIEGKLVCRNIKVLFNFEPPATEEEIRSAALQFVRKVSGFNQPSQANEAAFLAAVDTITAASTTLLDQLTTNAPSKNRAEEAARMQARSSQRFAK